MPSDIIILADEIAKALTGQQMGGFTLAAERLYDPTKTDAQLETLSIVVVPTAELGVPQNRERWAYAHDIDIGIRKLVPGLDKAQLDALMNLVQELRDWLTDHTIEAQGKRFWRPTALLNEPIWSPEDLLEDERFVSVIRVTYEPR